MKKTIISMLILSCFFFMTACGTSNNENVQKNSKQENKNEEKSVDKSKINTNQEIGELSFYIPDGLKLNITSTDNSKVFEINNSTTTINVWVVKKEDITDSIESYMENDNWKPTVSSMDKVEYNGHTWYVQPKGQFLMYTKYNNDVYKIKFNVLKDDTNYETDLKKLIPKSLVFNK